MLDARSPEDRRESTARRFFAGLTEFAFQSRLGVVDPPLVDYVSQLLERFVSTADVYSVRSVRGEQLTQVADMLLEAEERVGPARRRVHRHIGDFTLFWMGVYPEMAERMKRLGVKDALLDYRDQGRRAYFVASQIPTDNATASGELLERMADQFELIEYGLSEVRRLWNEREEGEPTGIIV